MDQQNQESILTRLEKHLQAMLDNDNPGINIKGLKLANSARKQFHDSPSALKRLVKILTHFVDAKDLTQIINYKWHPIAAGLYEDGGLEFWLLVCENNKFLRPRVPAGSCNPYVVSLA